MNLHGHTHKGSLFDKVGNIPIMNIGVVCKNRCGIIIVEKETDRWELSEVKSINFSNLDNPIIEDVYSK